jgi:hypothetical protein
VLHIATEHRMKSDAQLIEEARDDPDAFGELYRRHAEAVQRWFRARTDERTAEDLTAETFAQAVLSLVARRQRRRRTLRIALATLTVDAHGGCPLMSRSRIHS